ncbi:4-(cytidine 5'-diphospho)-2-C-methyl-D-erythritol kinase [Psychrobacter sp. I-STPA6b]|uniref:4-(cytidine 5'-diphospho)-2-C-methyl-D-erythritol kinase n=1 Tax=Psychrobacter sp. I-STPA6b TaxID=2585718 RepID=UPI001D0C6E46|nr:4-(cytidine 5'-diphospho)-2-C-methyl-D-erythritol kinase [Psychrobacter sp. I-STPA6b]
MKQFDTPPSLHMRSVAKLNLFLHITGRRDDGYHNLQTVFRLLDWGDTLSFWQTSHYISPNLTPVNDATELSTQLITLHCDIELTTNPQDNLIIKATQHLLQWLYKHQCLPTQLPIIKIHLDKQLPTGAGLGGGSSNAASTLLALNQLWQLNLTTKQLQQIGASVGADVPIFLYGQDAIAEGIGEKLTAIHLPAQHYVLLTPQAHISTAQLFAHPDLCRNMSSVPLTDIHHQYTDYLYQLNPPYCNVFEPVVCQLSNPVQQALDYLRTLEGITHSTARMTGSGSCVFLPFEAQYLSDIKDAIHQAPCTAIITNTITNTFSQK